MSDGELIKWERRFRSAAAADGGALLREHLRRLDLPDEPERLLEGTIRLVQVWAAYKDLDSDDFATLLDMQTYDARQASDARYACTFDLHRAAYARVVVETKVGCLDLADLYGHPWRDYRAVGFRRLWISHPDWSPLTSDERQQLQQEVSDDLYFDYTEEELDVWFDDELDDAYLLVTVQDVEDEA